MTQYRIDQVEVKMNPSLRRVSSKRFTLKQDDNTTAPLVIKITVPDAPVVKSVPVELAAGGHQLQRVLETLKRIIGEQLGAYADNLNTDSRFIADLGCDSLDTIELVMAVEDTFDIQIADEDAENMINVGDALKYLISKGIGRD